MKILIVTSYITSSINPSLLQNQTGFGYMVHDIAEFLGKKEEVDIFIITAMINKTKLSNFNIIGQTWCKWLLSFRLRNLQNAYRFLRKYPLPIKDSLRTLFYFISMGEIEKNLRSYDIVHIHGVGAMSDAAIGICKRQQVPFLLTLHGLNGFEDSIRLNPMLKKYEKDFLEKAVCEQYAVSFISSGIKKTAEEYIKSLNVKYAKNEIKTFNVVCNGCNIIPCIQTKDIRKEWGIPEKSFVFACVGNISENKNQMQVARVYSELPTQMSQQIHVLFIGKYKKEDDIYKFIETKHLYGNLHLCGGVSKSEIHNYYQSSNATILVSKSEGFGLSIIEGFVYGLPGLMFKDMAAVKDLYNNNCLVTMEDRTDKSLIRGMARIMSQKWKNDYICEYSQRFSLERMADSYINLFSKIISQKIN